MVEKNNDKEQTYTKYEKARILGARALQLSMGAPFLIKLSKEELEKLKYNTLEIAKKEFDAGVLPMAVGRPTPRDKQEQEESEEDKE